MNAYDTMLLARLRILPRGNPDRAPIPLAEVSSAVRAELDRLIASLATRTRLAGRERELRRDLYELLAVR
jgi:hypothetical protein